MRCSLWRWYKYQSSLTKKGAPDQSLDFTYRLVWAILGTKMCNRPHSSERNMSDAALIARRDIAAFGIPSELDTLDKSNTSIWLALFSETLGEILAGKSLWSPIGYEIMYKMAHFTKNWNKDCWPLS